MINKLSKFIICAAAFTALSPISSFAATSVSCQYNFYKVNDKIYECSSPRLYVPPYQAVAVRVEVWNEAGYNPNPDNNVFFGVKNDSTGYILWTGQTADSTIPVRIGGISSKRYLIVFGNQKYPGRKGVAKLHLKFVN